MSARSMIFCMIFPLKKFIESLLEKMGSISSIWIKTIFFIPVVLVYPALAQSVLFNFDNLPVHSGLPVSLTINGITAHFSATGQGYSIQAANTLGFTPQGFAGNCIYPNSIYLSDLLISFNQKLINFSIMYSVQELGCDNSATMRVTVYLNGSYVGTNTRVAANPGTWPVDTLRCIFPEGFDSVVVHYDSRPPTCQDYGVIFMADNMEVIPLNINSISETRLPVQIILKQNYPNPFNPITTISYHLPKRCFVTLKIYDLLGREILTLVDGLEQPGFKSVNFNGGNFAGGVYYYRPLAGNFIDTKKLILIK